VISPARFQSPAALHLLQFAAGVISFSSALRSFSFSFSPCHCLGELGDLPSSSGDFVKQLPQALLEAGSNSFFRASRSILSWIRRRSSSSISSGFESTSMRRRLRRLVDEVDGLVRQEGGSGIGGLEGGRGDDALSVMRTRDAARTSP